MINNWDGFAVNEKGLKINGISFLVTYPPRLKQLHKILKKRLKLLYFDCKTKAVFTPALFASYRTPHELEVI